LQKSIEKNRQALVAYENFCSELGYQPADVALAWLLNNPVVSAPIIGPRTIEQLEGCMNSLTIQFSPENLARLDEIFPGPGGRAPEAYAW
jgi:aryl-alcohol dehydrogenase-like predicted oxidoreductase